MQFHAYRPIESSVAATLAARGVPADAESVRRHMLTRDPAGAWVLRLQSEWQRDRRPYYRIWPGIVGPLLSLKLDRVQCRHVRLPLPTLCIELPAGRSIQAGSRELATVLVHQAPETLRALATWSDDAPFAQVTLTWRPEAMVEEAIPAAVEMVDPRDPAADALRDIQRAAILDAVRLVCMVALIGSDPELVLPRVLTADQAKFDQTRATALVERARRRGNVGWDIGRELPDGEERPSAGRAGDGPRSVAPHYRHGHPALVWTGHGREVPRIVFRRGTFVHGGQMAQVPTGFHAEAAPACPYCLQPMRHVSGRWECEDCQSGAAAQRIITGGSGAAHDRARKGKDMSGPGDYDNR